MMSTISFPKIFNNNSSKMSTNLSYSIKSVNESLKSLLLTNPGELLGDPKYGCGLKVKLFDLNMDANVIELRMIVYEAIDKYIRDIIVNSSQIKFYNSDDGTKYKIVIPYILKSSNITHTFITVI